jgi:hypothetical protein
MFVAMLIGLAVSCAFSAVAGWALMLAVGVVHHEWIPTCPTIGFWWAALLALLVRLALHQAHTSGGSN